MPGPVTVVGGANTDILGFIERALVPRDSNPGHVRTSAGGVGRNIAENLARLGIATRLVTAPGEGPDADALVAGCTAAGIDVRAVSTGGLEGPRYLAIMDERGDLALAVSDMRALEALTPGALDEHAAALDDAVAIVLDTNLPAETLAHVAERWAHKPLFLDTVSVAKAPRASGLLGSLHTLKTNELEAAALSRTAHGAVDAAVSALLAAGVPRVVVTGGIAGALFATAAERVRFVPPPARVVNATGAGDAYMAGLVFAELSGFDTTHTAAFASAMAAIALASERTVSEAVSEKAALEMMEAMLS
jgi:pseudouridine kinase